MLLMKTFFCDDCQFEWDKLCERDDPAPDCPVCARLAARIPGKVNIATAKSKAVDVAQQIVENEWGGMDVATNVRDGEAAAKAPAPMQTAERERMIREAVEMVAATTSGPMPSPVGSDGRSLQPAIDGFWQNTPMTATPAGAGLDGGATGAAQARQDGADPVELLHKAGKTGKMGPNGMPLTVLSKPESNNPSLLEAS